MRFSSIRSSVGTITAKDMMSGIAAFSLVYTVTWSPKPAAYYQYLLQQFYYVVEFESGNGLAKILRIVEELHTWNYYSNVSRVQVFLHGVPHGNNNCEWYYVRRSGYFSLANNLTFEAVSYSVLQPSMIRIMQNDYS